MQIPSLYDASASMHLLFTGYSHSSLFLLVFVSQVCRIYSHSNVFNAETLNCLALLEATFTKQQNRSFNNTETQYCQFTYSVLNFKKPRSVFVNLWRSAMESWLREVGLIKNSISWYSILIECLSTNFNKINQFSHFSFLTMTEWEIIRQRAD